MDEYDEPAWTGNEPCRKGHADLWFGGPGIHPRLTDIRKAKALCHSQCPRSSFYKCARKALKDPGNEGVWAGVHLPSQTNHRQRKNRPGRLEELKHIAAQDNSRMAS